MGQNSSSPLENFLSELSNENETEKTEIISALEVNDSSLQKQSDSFELSQQDKKADINLKVIYGISVIGILVVWEIFVILFTTSQLNSKWDKISDSVLIALLTSATANILVLPTIVLKYLFPKK